MATDVVVDKAYILTDKSGYQGGCLQTMHACRHQWLQRLLFTKHVG